MSVRPRRANRPSAWQVTFGTEDSTDDSATTSDTNRKRSRDGGGDADTTTNTAKRRNLDIAPRPARKYDTRTYELPETRGLLLFGEEQNPADDDKKPIRVLSRFTFFDARHDNIMISLDTLNEDAGGDHDIRGAGFVIAKYDIDSEDEGQEDGLDQVADSQYVGLSRILRYYTRYWEDNSPFYVETDHAIYELDDQNPSKRYRSQFRPFWRVQTILRFVVSSAFDRPDKEFSAFSREYCRVEVLGQSLTVSDLWNTRQNLNNILETVPFSDRIRNSKVVRHLFSDMPPVIHKSIGKRRVDQGRSMRDFQIESKGNLDLAVLKSKIPTHVTSRIAQIAVPLFREVLQVVAPRPRGEPGNEVPKDQLTLRLQGFLIRTQSRRRVQFRPDQRIGRSHWLKHILIDNVKYEVGDTVLFYPGQDIPPNPDNIPPTDTLADHFWFARIISIREDHELVHVQWFEHSSKTILQELGNFQELFLVNQCDDQALRHIIGKVNAYYIKPNQSLDRIKPHDFYYRYLWEESDGTFTNIDEDALAASARQPPPDNCPACEISIKFEEDTGPTKIHLGVRWHGVDYHLDDCTLIKADEGTCHIGQINQFIHEGHDVKVKVRLFGRVDRVGGRPDVMPKDERHLFYTDDEMIAAIDDLIGICYVVVKKDMPDLEAWLAMSSRHFYVRYHFPTLNVQSWDSRRRMEWRDIPICRMCMKENIKKVNGMKAFLESEAPLRVFDPFGGTGAFSLAMEDVGCFKLTHAAEISPSASKTLRNNASPNVKVYNQCSNLILRHAILTHENKDPEPLKSIENESLPPLPKPGEIDCIVTGFPCQPHSTLNMFQRANDKKSNLILTALSLVDFLKPSYCIFENVRGFLQYNLRARQDGKYSVKGGIPMGGLKLVAAALLDMGYQVRCALLQAAHYGTPQTRIRFFLIAAKRGLQLPPFPQPTHDFPDSDALEIKFPEGLVLHPITTLSGVAPHRYVSVYDAIDDLPKFDWKNPQEHLSRREMEAKGIKECREDQHWCGYQGNDFEYDHDPQTRFQSNCRRRPTRDIQQYTRTYPPPKPRVVRIPVRPNADYRSLPPEDWEYQNANPASSAGRSGYRAGFYGRIDGNEWFRTTVTNVDPMAKQSRVIHPDCKRILTVRELARSQGFPDHFVFHADHNRVMTMHRQIGNAVPWPVSVAIAREFRETLYKEWAKRNVVDEPMEEDFSSN